MRPRGLRFFLDVRPSDR